MNGNGADDHLLISKNKKQKVGVLIQARMTSTRFPGKVMAQLKGAPVLEHVVVNSQQIRGVDLVAVIVPDTAASEPVLLLAKKLGVQNFCGSELDVLDRYYNAAKFFDLDIIVRITSDCPFINPTVAGELLSLLKSRKLDYATNSFPKRTYPKGLDVEVFTRDCLEAAWTLADAFPSDDREHVTPWMQRAPGILRASQVQRVDASHINLCVDYPEDIERLEKTVFKVSHDN